MKLYVDLSTLELIEGPGFRNPVTQLRFKRGDAAQLEVVFLRNGATAEAIGDPSTLELHFGVKPRNRYDSGYLVHSSDWVLPAPEDESPIYQCTPSFNTTELNAALNLDSPAASELPQVTLMGEISWREGNDEPTSTRTFLVLVENDINRGDEGLPESADPPYPLPDTLELVSRKGVANGYASLNGNAKVPVAQLPSNLEYTSKKGVPHGYAELNEHGEVPIAQLPKGDIIVGLESVSNKGLIPQTIFRA